MPTSMRDKCFVISPFGEPFDTYFTHIIKPALESCGFYAIRGDSLYRPTTIMDDIWAGIQEAKLLVAELTDRNANVFYELGLAHALSKPVILISNVIDDVPFDLRAIRVLVYDKNHPEWGIKLRSDLTKAVQEVLQNPTSAIPATFKTPVRSKAPEELETLIRLEALEATVRNLTSNTENVFSDDTTVGSGKSREVYSSPHDLKIGQSIFHAKFGPGTVVGLQDGSRAHINFDAVGLKLLDLKVARLQPLQE